MGGRGAEGGQREGHREGPAEEGGHLQPVDAEEEALQLLQLCEVRQVAHAILLEVQLDEPLLAAERQLADRLDLVAVEDELAQLRDALQTLDARNLVA